MEIKDKEEEERNCETDTERKEKKDGTLGKGHKMEENDEETMISKQEEKIRIFVESKYSGFRHIFVKIFKTNVINPSVSFLVS